MDEEYQEEGGYQQAGDASGAMAQHSNEHEEHDQEANNEEEQVHHEAEGGAGDDKGGASDANDLSSPEAAQLASWDYGAPDSTDHCVRLRGLPWDATGVSILKFFSGSSIVRNGLVMLFDTKGTGYLSLASEADKANALKQHKKHLGKRYIEVEACTGEEFEKQRNGELNCDETTRRILWRPYSECTQNGFVTSCWRLCRRGARGRPREIRSETKGPTRGRLER
jgi:hypothetical protein